MSEQEMGLRLLPVPRQVEVLGGEVELSGVPVREEMNGAGLRFGGVEAYRLEVAGTGVVICARTEAGMRCGRATLAQLRRMGRVPGLVIEDAPKFAQRGVMLDISRDRVPTMATLFELVDRLAGWKMNHLQLYVEHTIAYAGHEAVWGVASPLTLEELSALDAYAAGRGVSLNANQNCLGHFERWLKHPRYAPLAERACGQMVRGEWYVRPNTLCPLDARVPGLLEDLLQQQLPVCSGGYANIGCDEPWDLGKGRSRAACERDGKGRVFSRHVAMVAELVRRLGKRPQYWCDPEPHEDDGLPRDLVALIWGYEKNSDLHMRAAAHRHAGREVWVAPGTSCWNSSTGRTWNRRVNLDHAAATPEAEGFLCTAWGDGGHRQPWPVTLAGFADAAMAAWSGAGQYDNAALGRHAFGNEALGDWLIRLGEVDAELCRGERPNWHGQAPDNVPLANRTALWQEMETPLFEMDGRGDVAAWQEVRERLQQLRRELTGVGPCGGSGAGSPDEAKECGFVEECAFAADVALWTVERAVVRRTGPTVPQRKQLAERMVELIETHRRQWLGRSRYGGLEDSTQRWLPHVSCW